MSNTDRPPELWSVGDIANWIGKGDATVRRRIVTLPNFPRPLPGSRQNRRWIKDDVIAFLIGETRKAA